MNGNNKKITLEQTQQQVEYPIPENNCEVKVYLNGYLIKTVYSLESDPVAFLKRVKADEDGQIKETEIFIELINGNQKKEIQINGLLRQVLITAWQDSK